MTMHPASQEARVLAIDPTSRGFGYAVLEGPAELIDWGVTEATWADNDWARKRTEELIIRYAPDQLVIEDVTASEARRRSRVRKLLQDLRTLATDSEVSVAPLPKNRIKRMFRSVDAANKEEFADAVISHFPELSRYRPPVRKPWMSEDSRMAIFDAVAFALAYYYFEDEWPRA